MAAIIVLPDETMEQICTEISTVDNVVVPVNYNCLEQVVISGNMDVIKEACTKLKGLVLSVLYLLLLMVLSTHLAWRLLVRNRFEAIEKNKFKTPICLIYQNVDALPHTEPVEIKADFLK